MTVMCSLLSANQGDSLHRMMLARNLRGICSELGFRLEFAWNSLGKRPGPAMRGTLHQGRGKRSLRRQEVGRDNFFLKSPGGGVSWARGEGPEGCLRGISGGRRLNTFFQGRNSHQENKGAPPFLVRISSLLSEEKAKILTI